MVFSILGRYFGNKISKKNRDENLLNESIAIELNILRGLWKDLKYEKHKLVSKNRTPNTHPILFEKIETREKEILERFNKLQINDEALEIADLEFYD